MKPAPATFVVIDEQISTAEALAFALETKLEATCVGTCHDVLMANVLIAAQRPSLIITDWHVGKHTALDLLNRRKSSTASRWILFTDDTTPYVVQAAAGSGVQGIVNKRAPLAELVSAIAAVLEGKEHLCQAAQRSLRLAVSAVQLGKRELETLAAIAEGMQTKQISDALGVSIKTTHNLLSSLRQKLRVSGGWVELARYAVENGIAARK